MNNHNLFHEIIVKGLQNNNHFILNLLHPNISMHILHTVLYIFPIYKENLFGNQDIL